MDPEMTKAVTERHSGNGAAAHGRRAAAAAVLSRPYSRVRSIGWSLIAAYPSQWHYRRGRHYRHGILGTFSCACHAPASAGGASRRGRERGGGGGERE
jgi:hypothetical protein